jgi:hypothetical protein
VDLRVCAARSACIGVCCTVVVGGCGKQGAIAGDSAAATAEAFAAALTADDLRRAATAFDYVTSARQQNEDWDDIPAGQRNLIIGKLADQRAGELGQYKERLGDDIKCGSVGQGSIVPLTGSAGSASIQLGQVDGKWYIENIW